VPQTPAGTPGTPANPPPQGQPATPTPAPEPKPQPTQTETYVGPPGILIACMGCSIGDLITRDLTSLPNNLIAYVTALPSAVGVDVTAAAETALSVVPKVLGMVTALTLSGDTPRNEVLYHYTTDKGAEGIQESGKIRQSIDGYTYLTPQYFTNGNTAQSNLALSQTPTGYFTIPKTDALPASQPGPVQPYNGQPGGGIEIKAPHPVKVNNLTFTRF
jgi:hypothetical protein